ncbi:MAG: dTDP-glucose 4,6-dehydratase [Candidatus Cloacimonetes bacterium]|nr:dTDP-glucose 4,6-dehydratase [Candidatus Cloacimonadota bacterium]
MDTVLVTGGAGFIGSNFIHFLISSSSYNVINLDALTYAGNIKNLSSVEKDSRYRFIKGDITSPEAIRQLVDLDFDYLVNFAAETHVDRSILAPDRFILTNILGTQNLLNLSLQKQIRKYIQISTDEVYGSLGREGFFSENSPLDPTSPYSASKASADLIVLAYFKTFDLPVNITRCSNNYGPYQFPEKLIPLMINNAVKNKPLPVYGDGSNIRDWIHVDDHCRGILQVMEKGRSGDIYNMGGNSEKQNLELVKTILEILGKPESLIRFVTDRKAHDWRYAVDYSKIRQELRWAPQVKFTDGIRDTIAWYLNNQDWLEEIVSGEYQHYYEKMYSTR